MLQIYWPAWLGAINFALVFAAYHAVTKKHIGVSGAWTKIVDRLTTRQPELKPVSFTAQELEAATQEMLAEMGVAQNAQPSGQWDLSDRRIEATPSLTASDNALFLVSLCIGAAGACFLGVQPPSITAAQFLHISSTAAVIWCAFGGLAIGFGTRMSGGCSSGHGICGVAHLQRPSMVATGVFFASAVATSYLLQAIAQ